MALKNMMGLTTSAGLSIKLYRLQPRAANFCNEGNIQYRKTCKKPTYKDQKIYSNYRENIYYIGKV